MWELRCVDKSATTLEPDPNYLGGNRILQLPCAQRPGLSQSWAQRSQTGKIPRGSKLIWKPMSGCRWGAEVPLPADVLWVFSMNIFGKSNEIDIS